MGKSFSKAANTVKIHTEQNTSIAGLASKTVTKFTQALAMETSFRMLRAEIQMSLVGWSQSEETGPLMIGMAPNQYTNIEIEEWIEENGPSSPRDDTPMERSRRRIWILGMFVPERGIDGQQSILKMSKVLKPQWTFTVGSSPGGWNYWFYNWSGSAMNAETKVLQIMADYYGIWVI